MDHCRSAVLRPLCQERPDVAHIQQAGVGHALGLQVGQERPQRLRVVGDGPRGQQGRLPGQHEVGKCITNSVVVACYKRQTGHRFLLLEAHLPHVPERRPARGGRPVCAEDGIRTHDRTIMSRVLYR